MTLSRKLAMVMVQKGVSVHEVTETLRIYNLLGLLPSILSSVTQIVSHRNARNVVGIESPFPLSENSIVHIKKIMGVQTENHEVTINKSILAGFKARWKGVLYDGSAERIIRQLTK